MAEKEENRESSEANDQQAQETQITQIENLSAQETQVTQIGGDAAQETQMGEAAAQETQVTQVGEQLTQETAMLTTPPLNEDALAQTETPTIQIKPDAPTQGPSSGSKPKSKKKNSDAKYEIIKRLGKGGFATVYLVKNTHLNRLEAMKVLASELATDEEVIERFVKEARIAANFMHQNIVTIFEVQQRSSWENFQAEQKIMDSHKEPLVYFTMTFVEGNSLTGLARKKRLDQKKAIRTIMDAAMALDYAHGKGVVHRDIKPDNIMVDRKGTAVVMDFGIAKAADQTRHTAAGTFMGTARYVSPEQAMGKEIDGRSDIYSLGVTLYEVVTGRAPFDSDQWMTVLYQHINEPPPAPELYFEGIDRDLRAVILKMLAKKPAERFQNAREVYDALGHIYQKLGGPDFATTPMESIPTRPNPMQEQQTAVTELPGARRAGEPPVRTESHPAKQHEEEAPDKKSPIGLIIGIVAVAMAAVTIFLLMGGDPETPPQSTPDLTAQQQGPARGGSPTPAPALDGPPGKLMITAFPKGELLRITHESGQQMEVTNQALPLAMDLPEGSYNLIVSYKGRTEEKKAFVSASQDQSLVHFEFELEDDAFLLDDVK